MQTFCAMQPQPIPGSPFLFAILIAVAVYAIVGSDKRWRTFGVMLLFAAVGLGIGTVLGLVMRKPELAGTLAGLLSTVGVLSASIRQIVDNRKRRKKLS